MENQTIESMQTMHTVQQNPSIQSYLAKMNRRKQNQPKAKKQSKLSHCIEYTEEVHEEKQVHEDWDMDISVVINTNYTDGKNGNEFFCSFDSEELDFGV